MTIAILNVGLNVGGKLVQTPVSVLDVLYALGIGTIYWEVMNSDTERTVIAEIARPLTQQEAHAMAVVLRQEAIAQYVPATGKGKSYGPQSGRWVFNPHYFLLINGERLKT